MLSAGAVRVLAVAHRAGNDLDALRAAVENGADVVEGDVVRALRERVHVVMTWPVNDEQSLESVLSVGVTGVITDDARVLRAVVGLRTPG